MNENNPLLDFSGLPRFTTIRPEHVTPAVEALIDEVRATIERVATDARPASWDGVAAPIARALDRLDRAWSAVRHLNAVVSTPELRDAMKTETQLFFDWILRQNRPIGEFIDARYTFLNEMLATYYGIEGVTGPESPVSMTTSIALATMPRTAGLRYFASNGMRSSNHCALSANLRMRAVFSGLT